MQIRLDSMCRCKFAMLHSFSQDYPDANDPGVHTELPRDQMYSSRSNTYQGVYLTQPQCRHLRGCL